MLGVNQIAWIQQHYGAQINPAKLLDRHLKVVNKPQPNTKQESAQNVEKSHS